MKLSLPATKLKLFSGAIQETVEEEFNKWAVDKSITNFQATWNRGNFYLMVLYTDVPVIDWPYMPVQPLSPQYNGPFGPLQPCEVGDPVPNPYEITSEKDPTNGEFIFH